MLFLITYDVNTNSAGGEKRLRQVAKACVNYGQRVQNSVFECSLNMLQLEALKKRLLDIIDLEKDSIRIYDLGKNWERKLEHFGTKKGYNPNEITIV